MDESLAKEEENPLYITDKNENPVKILAKMKKKTYVLLITRLISTKTPPRQLK